jgi:hypothetical protein
MKGSEENESYKWIVIIGTGIFLFWATLIVHKKASEYSEILGGLTVPILMYFYYKIMSAFFRE